MSSIPRWELWSPGLWQVGPSLWSCLPARGSPLRGVPGSPVPGLTRGGTSCLGVGWRGRSSVDLGRDLRRWLSRREPRVLSIQSQVRSMLWTSCMHWMYPVLYFCWASRPNVGSAGGKGGGVRLQRPLVATARHAPGTQPRVMLSAIRKLLSKSLTSVRHNHLTIKHSVNRVSEVNSVWHPECWWSAVLPDVSRVPL